MVTTKKQKNKKNKNKNNNNNNNNFPRTLIEYRNRKLLTHVFFSDSEKKLREKKKTRHPHPNSQNKENAKE